MNSTTNYQSLVAFRDQIYNAFTRAKDALMNTADALLTETQAQSLPELSLSPHFHRRWHSLYEAFQDGVIDRDSLRNAFVRAVPLPQSCRIVLGTDASSIARPKSKTARDRTLVHESNLPDGCPPVVPGWQFSTLALLPESPSSWTYTLDNSRINSDQKTANVAAQQLRQALALLLNCSDSPPLLIADGYYCCLSFLLQTQDIPCDKLVRLAKNRRLYRAAPPRTGKRGRPKKHGSLFQPNNPLTQQEPDDSFQGENIKVDCWKQLHFREAPDFQVTVIRVIREAATNTKRDPRVSWFLFVGECMPALSEISVLYARRYSIEHAYRVDKQDLLWERVRLRTPEQFERWTDVVACVRNQLVLARDLSCVRQPWERESKEATPSQVRRGLRRILPQLGTPARWCQPRGKSPGRALGFPVTRAERFAVLRKSPKTIKKKRALV
jgi:hypothetical protein